MNRHFMNGPIGVATKNLGKHQGTIKANLQETGLPCSRVLNDVENTIMVGVNHGMVFRHFTEY